MEEGLLGPAREWLSDVRAASPAHSSRRVPTAPARATAGALLLAALQIV
jgi:hypothetical protein